MKAFLFAALVLSPLAALAEPVAKCTITTGDGDGEPITVRKSFTVNESSSSNVSFGGNEYSVYARSQRSDWGAVFISISGKSFVISAYDHIRYLDVAGLYALECEVKD